MRDHTRYYKLGDGSELSHELASNLLALLRGGRPELLALHDYLQDQMTCEAELFAASRHEQADHCGEVASHAHSADRQLYCEWHSVGDQRD